MKQLLVPTICVSVGIAIGIPIGVNTHKVKGYRSCVLTHVRPGLSDYATKLVHETCRGMFPPRTQAPDDLFGDLIPSK